MKRITLVFGVVVVMAAMMVALAAPAMAKQGGNNNGGNSGSSFKSSGSSFNSNSGGVTHFSGGGGDFGGSSWSSGSSWSWDDDGFSNLDVEQEAVSGDIDLEADISLSGDNSNQSAPVVQFANTGNNQDALVFDQFDSEVEDFEFEGGFISFDPEFEFAADQEVEQSSAA